MEDLCTSHDCDYQEAKVFYFKQIETVTGPSHLRRLFKPESLGDEGMKRAFTEFFEWFLKERYVRYLILEGKMERKLDYIRYKNRVLMELFSAHA